MRQASGMIKPTNSFKIFDIASLQIDADTYFPGYAGKPKLQAYPEATSANGKYVLKCQNPGHKRVDKLRFNLPASNALKQRTKSITCTKIHRSSCEALRCIVAVKLSGTRPGAHLPTSLSTIREIARRRFLLASQQFSRSLMGPFCRRVTQRFRQPAHEQ